MKKWAKIAIPSVVVLGIIGAYGESNDTQYNLDTTNDSYKATEINNLKSKEEETKSTNTTSNENENKDNDKKDSSSSTNADKNTSANKTSTNSSSNDKNENNNLPLKAICKDGTVSYQDNASKPDYRGMCSGHGGIKTKLGRVK